MQDFKNWLENNNNLIKLYHGGYLWDQPQILPSKKNRYEHGTGIYLTTNYNTARKYAKGNKIVLAVFITPNFKLIDQIQINPQTIIDFLNSIRIKNKQNIIQDILNYQQRTQRPTVPLSILNNLVVNYEAASGKVSLLINQFLVQNGADAEIDKKYDEDWLIVFNTKIIKHWEKTKDFQDAPRIPTNDANNLQ